MDKTNQIANLLGLAQRANRLVVGEQKVLGAIRTNKAKLVFLAADAGQASAKKYEDKCNSYRVALTRVFTRAQLTAALGRPRVCVAVTDAGFAKSLTKALCQD